MGKKEAGSWRVEKFMIYRRSARKGGAGYSEKEYSAPLYEEKNAGRHDGMDFVVLLQ